MSAVLSPREGASANNVRNLPVNALALLTTRLLKIPLQAIAEAIGKDESAACRIRSNERPCTLTEFCSLLELAGFKLVSRDKQCVPADELAMLRRVYAAHHNVDLWTDPE
jgi:hypothetical protein